MERTIKEVLWTTRAIKDLEKLTRFNFRLYGFQKAMEISFRIRERTEIFENSHYNFNKIGAIDEDFGHLKRSGK